ncbi:MAG: hypothetical protein ABWX96_05305 [Propionibacteriaceae bacterium]
MHLLELNATFIVSDDEQDPKSYSRLTDEARVRLAADLRRLGYDDIEFSYLDHIGE